jgi:tetratricopeptide (TPR) repeat protein
MYFRPMPTREEIDEALEKGALALCRELCERFLRDHPNDVSLLCLHGENLTKLAQYEEAVQTIEKAEKLAPAKIVQWVLTKRGHLQEAMGNFGGAVKTYLRAHSLNPSEAAHLIFAAAATFRSGDISTAIDLASRATKCGDGSNSEAYYNLGGYLLVQRHYEDARDCFRRALEIDPDYEIARERLNDMESVLMLQHAESVPIHLLPTSQEAPLK